MDSLEKRPFDAEGQEYRHIDTERTTDAQISDRQGGMIRAQYHDSGSSMRNRRNAKDHSFLMRLLHRPNDLSF